MRIGIVGTGNMGRALGTGWARAGHQVLFGSRDPGKARAVAAACAAEAGDQDTAAAFGEVVLYTVREVLPSALLRHPRVLAGKVLVDCNNTAVLGLDVPHPQRLPGLHFQSSAPSLAERLAADAPEARVVKAFNTLPAKAIELGRDVLRRHGVSAFLCADDDAAKASVRILAEDLGLRGVDGGELARAGLAEALADFVRLQILVLARPPTITLSLRDLEEVCP